MQTTLPPQYQYQPPAKPAVSPARYLGLLAIVLGIAGFWFNHHLAATKGEFYIKLCVLGPLAVFGGVLMAVRPEWAGPMRPDSTRAHKLALFAVIGLMAVGSGIDFYVLHNSPSPRRAPTITHWTPAMGTPVLPAALASVGSLTAATELSFLSRTYRLGSFNQKSNPQWEFITPDETIDNWKTLLTVVDRPDARTKEDLDHLAEGIMGTYKSHGGQILLAKTMQDSSGAVYNYMVAAFEDPAKKRFELNFVKMSLGAKNAVTVIYGVRVADPDNYQAKAKEFLSQSSGEVGRALATTPLPDVSRLPRRVF